MKFLYTFLLLLSIFSTIYSDSCEDQKKKYEDCIDAYLDMYHYFTEERDFKTVCSERCKKFYTDSESTIPNCSGGSSYRSELKDSYLVIKDNLSLNCATDEEGNNCPNTQELVNGNLNAKNREEAEEIAEKSCKSKLCTDSLREIHRLNIRYKSYSSDMYDKLNSQECISQHSTTDSSNKSITSTDKKKSDGFNFPTGLIYIILFFSMLIIGLFLLMPKSLSMFVYGVFNRLKNDKSKNNLNDKV